MIIPFTWAWHNQSEDSASRPTASSRAMEVVTGAMGNLLPKLGELLKEEYKLQKGVKTQVESLGRELESLHAALRKVAEVPRDQLDEQVKLWARDVRELSYDMEDVVDTFLVRVEDDREATNQHWLKRLLEKMGSLFSEGKTRRQIADAIKDINKQAQEVANRRGRYTVDSIVAKPAATSTIDPRLFAMYKNAAHLVGVDGPRDALIKMLSEGDDVSKKKMKIISVVGFGGLGKTTLATTVYHKLKAGFNCHAFVPVGQNPDIKKVLKDILIGLDKQKYTNLNMTVLDERQLIDELREFLENKRYFIVIDDIWDKKSWEIIRCALADSNRGSIVVTTTRISELATNAGDVYKLQPLSRDNSEKLFRTRIVDCEGKCPPSESTEVYDKILKKCGGVPLAIITIASLLASKPGEDWSEVYNSIGFGHGDNEDVENTRKILSFSYYDLPSHLRTCLLYLSVFPEDYLIRKDCLIRKWIAEGFVHEEQGIGLLEVGDRYFNELINRSMIEPVETEYIGYVYGCRVHDMVLDLVRSLSREENFVIILDNEQRTFPQSNKARRLALQHRMEEHNPQANMEMQHVRSFIATLCHAIVISTSFRVLRVLAIEGCGFMEGYNSLTHLGKLLHLRYLGLTSTPVRELPKEIGNLKFLQTLDLKGTGIEELPSSVGLLAQLVFLRVDRNTRVSDWIGNLTSLQELWIWPAADRSARFVKELGNLRELRLLVTEIDVVDESMERALVESLGNLHRIQVVNITGKSLGKGATCELGFVSPRHLRYLLLTCLRFSRLPAWINSSLLPNLCLLHVFVHDVQEQDMETLGRLPQLRGLELWSWYTPVVNMTIGGDGHLFHKLRFFTMHRISVLLCSVAPIMPSLEALKFTVQVRFMKDADLGFDKLGLENIPSLQKVTAHIDCKYARAAEVEEAEAALSHTAAVHPNRPTLRTIRKFEDGMLPSEQDQVPAFLCDKVVDYSVNVREEKDEEHRFNFCVLLWNPCVEKLNVSINCEDARPGEVEEAEAAARYAVDVHPNHPTLEMMRYAEDKMMLSDQHQQPGNEICNVAAEERGASPACMQSSKTRESPSLIKLKTFETPLLLTQPAWRSDKVVDFNVNVREEKDEEHRFNLCGLLWNPCVEKLNVSINCEDARPGEVEEAEAAARYAVDVHPNHPTLEMTRYAEDKMMLSDQHQQPASLSDKVIDYNVNVRKEKDEEHRFNLCGLLWNPWVEKLNVSINCADARPGEVEEAEAALRHAVDVHPIHPTLEMTRYAEDKMILSNQHQQPLQPYKRIRR